MSEGEIIHRQIEVVSRGTTSPGCVVASRWRCTIDISDLVERTFGHSGLHVDPSRLSIVVGEAEKEGREVTPWVTLSISKTKAKVSSTGLVVFSMGSINMRDARKATSVPRSAVLFGSFVFDGILAPGIRVIARSKSFALFPNSEGAQKFIQKTHHGTEMSSLQELSTPMLRPMFGGAGPSATPILAPSLEPSADAPLPNFDLDMDVLLAETDAIVGMSWSEDYLRNQSALHSSGQLENEEGHVLMDVLPAFSSETSPFSAPFSASPSRPLVYDPQVTISFFSPKSCFFTRDGFSLSGWPVGGGLIHVLGTVTFLRAQDVDSIILCVGQHRVGLSPSDPSASFTFQPPTLSVAALLPAEAIIRQVDSPLMSFSDDLEHLGGDDGTKQLPFLAGELPVVVQVVYATASGGKSIIESPPHTLAVFSRKESSRSRSKRHRGDSPPSSTSTSSSSGSSEEGTPRRKQRLLGTSSSSSRRQRPPSSSRAKSSSSSMTTSPSTVSGVELGHLALLTPSLTEEGTLGQGAAGVEAILRSSILDSTLLGEKSVAWAVDAGILLLRSVGSEDELWQSFVAQWVEAKGWAMLVTSGDRTKVRMLDALIFYPRVLSRVLGFTCNLWPPTRQETNVLRELGAVALSRKQPLSFALFLRAVFSSGYGEELSENRALLEDGKRLLMAAPTPALRVFAFLVCTRRELGLTGAVLRITKVDEFIRQSGGNAGTDGSPRAVQTMKAIVARSSSSSSSSSSSASLSASSSSLSSMFMGDKNQAIPLDDMRWSSRPGHDWARLGARHGARSHSGVIHVGVVAGGGVPVPPLGDLQPQEEYGGGSEDDGDSRVWVGGTDGGVDEEERDAKDGIRKGKKSGMWMGGLALVFFVLAVFLAGMLIGGSLQQGVVRRNSRLQQESLGEDLGLTSSRLGARSTWADGNESHIPSEGLLSMFWDGIPLNGVSEAYEVARIRARGYVICGLASRVWDSLEPYSGELDVGGVRYCSGVAAAILQDPSAVRFVNYPLVSTELFPDVIVANASVLDGSADVTATTDPLMFHGYTILRRCFEDNGDGGGCTISKSAVEIASNVTRLCVPGGQDEDAIGRLQERMGSGLSFDVLVVDSAGDGLEKMEDFVPGTVVSVDDCDAFFGRWIDMAWFLAEKEEEGVGHTGVENDWELGWPPASITDAYVAANPRPEEVRWTRLLDAVRDVLVEANALGVVVPDVSPLCNNDDREQSGDENDDECYRVPGSELSLGEVASVPAVFSRYGLTELEGREKDVLMGVGSLIQVWAAAFGNGTWSLYTAPGGVNGLVETGGSLRSSQIFGMGSTDSLERTTGFRYLELRQGGAALGDLERLSDQSLDNRNEGLGSGLGVCLLLCGVLLVWLLRRLKT